MDKLFTEKNRHWQFTTILLSGQICISHNVICSDEGIFSKDCKLLAVHRYFNFYLPSYGILSPFSTYTMS